MFINLTNHPSDRWSEEQRKAAEAFGKIVDIPFPLVNENATEAEIEQLAGQYSASILGMGKSKDLIVHVMGEQTFCYALVSKLQKEGIRCIASCTKHDSFINEDGQKVSTFHFTRFREYDANAPKTLRWWKNIKKCINAFSREKTGEKEQYSWYAIFILLLVEVTIICLLQRELLLYSALTLVFAILVLVFIRNLSHQTFKIRSTIVSKLLANAITPTFIGTTYLLAFVLHIGWLSNAIHGLYSTNGAEFLLVLASVCVSTTGLLTLIVFFPDGRQTKDTDCEQVFITGISSFSPKVEAWPKEYDKLNLIPLVRILQLLNDGWQRSRMVVLLTDKFKNDENTFAVLKHVMALVNPAAADEIEKQITVQDKLALLIREVAKREFPNKASQIENMEIEFTEPCSYLENFEVAFNILENKVKELDNAKHQLYFNLTPGTGIIGSLMTLMAIDGDRDLYYYSQENMPNEAVTDEEKEAFKQTLLKPVDKSRVPLQALLSQALEST